MRKRKIELFFSLDQCVVVGTSDPTLALKQVLENLELGALDHFLDGVSREEGPDGERVYGASTPEDVREFSDWCHLVMSHAKVGDALLWRVGGKNPELKWTFREDYRSVPVVVFWN